MRNISSLAYADFLRASRTGSADVSVHRQLASHVMDTSRIPKDYRIAYRLWTWIWLSLVPVVLAIGSLYSWWWAPALVALLVMAQAITRSRTATSFIVDYAREDELFYDIMVQLGVMRVSENPRPVGRDG